MSAAAAPARQATARAAAVVRTPRAAHVAALVAYGAISILYFGVRVVVHRGGLVGTTSDPDLFSWMLGWWPHAILHGQNPFESHVVWAPTGVNLGWATSVPGLALPVAPITLLFGPAAAYNVLAILLPPLAAWTAYLLCRHLTGAFWPSAAGGYLFGFSSYMLGEEQAHLHMTAVFLIPVVALLVLRFLQRSIRRRTFVVLLGVAIAWQLAIATEVAFTMTFALAVCLVVAFALVPGLRSQLLGLLRPLAYSYAVGALLAAPLLAYILKNRQPVGNPPAWFPGDLLNIVSPTSLTWINTSWSERMAGQFRTWSGESGLYLGLPLLAIVVWFAWSQRRSRATWVLAVVLALALFFSLGTELDIAGTRYAWLPWNAVTHLPLFDSTIPVRFSLYAALAAAIIAALWSASAAIPRAVRLLVTAAAIAALVPNVTLGNAWFKQPERPAFFTSGLYRQCFVPGDNVLMLPIPGQTDAMLWQAEAGYSFRMADGYISAVPPTGIPDWGGMVGFFVGAPLPSAQELIQWTQEDGVTVILVDGPSEQSWRSVLAGVARPKKVGDVYLYRLEPSGSPACSGAGASAAGDATMLAAP